MAKIDFRKIRNEYIRRSMRYADGVRLLYDQALADIAREFALLDYNPDAIFSFSEYGKFGRVDSIMSRLEQQIQAVVNVGIENEFGKAYSAHNDLLKQVLGDNITTELERAFAPRITSGNAAKLYISETESNNITRSMRVWNGATLGQMETAVQEALMEGMPAQQMAGLIEQYLNDPESCFRRFRIKTGVDADGMSMYGRKWMKRVRNEDGSTSWFDADPRDYPTGQGVYHSSYQNALRYTRTTTNIAYRTADYERYQTEDFVLGIEIHITGNPEHVEDICDMLQGRYPKDFKWVGWHTQCRCYEVPILATPDEVNAMADAIMNDQDPSTVPVAGRVTDVPDNFKEWVSENEDRIQETIDKGKQLPYFLRDNQQYVNVSQKSSINDENNVRIVGTSNMTEHRKASLINDIESLKESAHLFSDNNDIKIVIQTLDGYDCMAVNRNELIISDKIFAYPNGDTYCPAEALKSAIDKLKHGKKIDFYEEYAVETLFHESLHTRMSMLTKGKKDELIFETCTQLYARGNYEILLKDGFNAIPMHKGSILNNGLGYRYGCKKLRPFFVNDGVVKSQDLMNILLSDNRRDSFINYMRSLGYPEETIEKFITML